MLLWLASNWPWFAAVAAVALVVCVPGLAGFLFGTKLGRVILVVALTLGVGFWQRTDGFAEGYQSSEAAHKAEADRVAERELVATALVSEANRKAERARTGALHSADVAYQRGLSDGKAAVDVSVGDVHAGRVRDRFKCPTPQGGAGAPAASAGLGDGGAPRGLSDADAEFLVRFAGEADDTRRQLAACQVVVRADREAVTP